MKYEKYFYVFYILHFVTEASKERNGMKTPTVMPEEIPHDVIISCPSDKNVTQQVCMRKFHQRHSMFGCLHIYRYFLESLTWKERLKNGDMLTFFCRDGYGELLLRKMTTSNELVENKKVELWCLDTKKDFELNHVVECDKNKPKCL